MVVVVSEVSGGAVVHRTGRFTAGWAGPIMKCPLVLGVKGSSFVEIIARSVGFWNGSLQGLSRARSKE